MLEKKINSFTQDDYEIVKREVLYQGVFRLARYQVRYRLFNGGFTHVISRELFERKYAVAVLPYDPILDRIVLIEQFRIGAIANPISPWLIEIVAGVIEPDEQPENVALRESKEEANCDILDLHLIYKYFLSPGGSNEYLHLFCGRIDASNSGGIHGLHEEEEDIRAFTISSDDAFTLLEQGKMNNSPTIIALQWLQLNKNKLRKLWSKK